MIWKKQNNCIFTVENEGKDMKCCVCEDGEMQPYFKKAYDSKKTFEFYRCPECGLVINKTVYDMDSLKWAEINDENMEFQGEIDQNNSLWNRRLGRIKPQAKFLAELFYNNLFEVGIKSVDYGCGDGLLSDMAGEIYVELAKCDEKVELIGKYERFLDTKDERYYSDFDMRDGTFDLAVSAAVLEHMIGMDDVDRFFRLVSPTGTAIIHTLICEEVPCDPEWFYIWKPFHCTIWTNKAMAMIYKKYGFLGCAYHVQSKMWIFFKDFEKYKKAKSIAGKIDGEWVFSENFVDYWKQKPYKK